MNEKDTSVSPFFTYLVGNWSTVNFRLVKNNLMRLTQPNCNTKKIKQHNSTAFQKQLDLTLPYNFMSKCSIFTFIFLGVSSASSSVAAVAAAAPSTSAAPAPTPTAASAKADKSPTTAPVANNRRARHDSQGTWRHFYPWFCFQNLKIFLSEILMWILTSYLCPIGKQGWQCSTIFRGLLLTNSSVSLLWNGIGR